MIPRLTGMAYVQDPRGRELGTGRYPSVMTVSTIQCNAMLFALIDLSRAPDAQESVNRRPDHLLALWPMIDWTVIEKRYEE